MSQPAETTAEQTAPVTTKKKGITKDFFTRPIPIPCTLKEVVVGEDGQAEVVEHATLFMLSQQRPGLVENLQKKRILAEMTDDVFFLHKLAILLDSEPVGFNDFPKDDRPLQERAFEYFKADGMSQVVYTVVGLYDLFRTPRELLERS